jgi:transglutaminase/protease-like cytokinesis protein 3
VIPAKLVVIRDSSSPVIHGITDKSIVQGETPDLSKGVYATDDISNNIPVRIDASKLKTDVPGKYEIIYKAQDDAGNTTTGVSTVTVNAKPQPKTKKKATVKKRSTNYGQADKLAEALLKKLKRGSKTETARAIFKWVHNNIHYVHSASKLKGKRAAYQGLTRHSGNCRVFAYTCQLLLNKAGIRNMIVSRYPVTTHHYWNLVYLDGGWYHCDATPFRGHNGIYFKLTDAKLDKHHKFKKDKYPARATS